MSLITPDFGLLFWMTLIFGIVFFILAKFGFPMITGMVKKRSDSIEKSLSEAEAARKALAQLAEEQKRLIDQAKKEQSRIINEASAAGEKIIADAKEEARVQTEAMIEKAREDIRIERESAMREVRGQVASLSVDIAEKLVRGHLEASQKQGALLDKLIEKARNGQNVN